jgi:hypothetical protein
VRHVGGGGKVFFLLIDDPAKRYFGIFLHEADPTVGTKTERFGTDFREPKLAIFFFF